MTSLVAPHDFIVRGEPALVLAPMEGVTDFPMRLFQCESGAFRYGVCEFIRVSQEIPPPKVFHRYVPELRLAGDHFPVQVQILGGDPEKMAMAAMAAVGCGARAIDINFGCPAPTVNRHDGGATLLKFPCRLEAVVRAVRDAVPVGIPVSAKLRLGWDDPLAIYRNAERVEAGGADWITIHGRTRLQGYAPPALWEPIGETRRSVSIPVVANGDIWSVEDFLRCQEVTGCEHFMLGRGALANPWLPREIAARLGIKLGPIPAWYGDGGRFFGGGGRRKAYWIQPLKSFVAHAAPYFTHEGYVVRRTKQWLRMAALRDQFQSFDEVKKIASLDELSAWLRSADA